MSKLFEEIKQRVTPEEVAVRYYQAPVYGGFIPCPFHNEKTPSMKVGGRNLPHKFKCMGCGWTGDVLDFTQQFFNITTIEAIEKLNDDFNIGLDLAPPSKEELQRREREQAEINRFKSWRSKYLNKTIPGYSDTVLGIKKILPKIYLNPAKPYDYKNQIPKEYVTFYEKKETGEIEFLKTKEPVQIYESETILPVIENFVFTEKKNFKINPLKPKKGEEGLLEEYIVLMVKLQKIRELIPNDFELKIIYNKLKKTVDNK